MLEKAPDLRGNIKIIDIEVLVPAEHLYCEYNGQPAADSVVLVKMAFIQHLYGVKSLHQTMSRQKTVDTG